MSNEYGEDPKFYVYPLDHEDGEPFPEDFYKDMTEALRSVGMGWETA